MLGKRERQQDLLESFGVRKVGSDHFLLKLNRLIDWRGIERRLEALYPSLEGRPSYPPLILFKALLLAQFYNLSDPELEEQVNDRLSFQKFLGLSITEDCPDETTYCRFRNRLHEAGLFEELFRKATDQLEAKGMMLKKGSIVDASLIESRYRNSDPEGRWTSRKKGPMFGYKLHVSSDPESDLIQEVEMTPASTHDSEVMEDVLPGEVTEVYGDKAYDSFKRRFQFQERGIFYGILKRTWRSQPLTEKDKRLNRRFSKIRSRVERIFAHLKNIFGFREVRFRGLLKNRGHAFLIATAYNLGRALRLAEAT
jgi:IS5 family transposase